MLTRVPGLGARASTGTTAGDLYVRVNLRPHPRFERRGDDLESLVVISVQRDAQAQTNCQHLLRSRRSQVRIPSVTGAITPSFTPRAARISKRVIGPRMRLIGAENLSGVS